MTVSNVINEKQLKKFKRIFLLTGKTFQVLAEEAGLEKIPTHADELSHDQARQFLKHHKAYLIQPKIKQ